MCPPRTSSQPLSKPQYTHVTLIAKSEFIMITWIYTLCIIINKSRITLKYPRCIKAIRTLTYGPHLFTGITSRSPLITGRACQKINKTGAFGWILRLMGV
ncbi:hypothetical protein MTR67_000359 [Solanum verrucosum]|uniref:Uncharacterized protein n=1 Tax=Solanum verrucosum TaxID=315347 RepID=A0AAF0PL60_SOLVR|nr:hypothetical protein MTR67_000359 [Solanum verrucosum]